MPVWDDLLTERDKAVFAAAGYGRKGGLGSRPAVIVIDVNYNFTGEKPEPILESIKKWRNSCGEEGWQGVAAIRELLEAAREKDLPIFYSTGTDRRADMFDDGRWSSKNSRSGEQKGAPGFNGNDIVAEIAPHPRDVVIRKEKPSVFFGTPLAGYLIDLGVDSLIIAGTTTSGCVRATVLDAFSYNYRLSVVEECCFDRGEASHKINLFDMNAKYADVVSLSEAKESIAGLPTGVFRASRLAEAPAPELIGSGR